MATSEFVRLLQIALQFAREGNEGRPIGTVFVLGKTREMKPYLRQLVLNPCCGHPRSRRNIHNPDFLESLRELSALDGAFIVNTRGVVERAGAYLNVSGKAHGLRAGWGARHTAAALITARTKSVSIAISQSSGTVTVFLGGRAILEMEQAVEE
jgi:DNA integrity scanning protein DisA with diadenylate cyclase activity